jgi:hypothetical protein
MKYFIKIWCITDPLDEDCPPSPHVLVVRQGDDPDIHNLYRTYYKTRPWCHRYDAPDDGEILTFHPHHVRRLMDAVPHTSIAWGVEITDVMLAPDERTI